MWALLSELHLNNRFGLNYVEKDSYRIAGHSDDHDNIVAARSELEVEFLDRMGGKNTISTCLDGTKCGCADRSYCSHIAAWTNVLQCGVSVGNHARFLWLVGEETQEE